MQVKKSPKADLDRLRIIFLEIGAVVALAACLVAFEWSSEDASMGSLGDLTIDEVIEEEIDNTIQEEEQPEEPEPEPEPEPEQVIEELVIVEDDVKVDDININSEADEKTQTQVHIVETIEIEAEEEVEPVAFAAVENKPEYPGGDMALMKYLAENTKYPAIAKENGVSGRVFVQFVIDKTGAVTKVKVLRGVDPALDAEAVRVVKAMPSWKPGSQRGKAVPVTYQVPINFKLN